jgi:alkanesulfonate monooxygenase SsuD/methylene tetrahydromethanopterin reductase-like flavin-dependent oxidoreductase (luciferase family)
MNMRIGISVSSSYPGVEPRAGARWMVERAHASRHAGLDSLFVGDHHVTPTNYYQNSPILGRMLAEWGAQPAGALYLLPLWNPVLLAEQVATLASIAQGPFILQCGLGGDRRQSLGMGVDPARRVGMFETALETLRALWRGEEVTLERYWPIRRARIAPLPPQPVDVWIGAQAPVAIERAARLGDGWLAAPSLIPEEARTALDLYRGACVRHGRAPGTAALRRDIYVGESAEDARRVVEPYLAAGYRGFPSESLVFGSAEEVAEQLRGFAEMGYDEIVVRNLSARQEECLATIERLAEVRRLLD